MKTNLQKTQFVEANWFWFLYNKQKKINRSEKFFTLVLRIVIRKKHVQFKFDRRNSFCETLVTAIVF